MEGVCDPAERKQRGLWDDGMSRILSCIHIHTAIHVIKFLGVSLKHKSFYCILISKINSERT